MGKFYWRGRWRDDSRPLRPPRPRPQKRSVKPPPAWSPGPAPEPSPAAMRAVELLLDRLDEMWGEAGVR